MQPLSLPDTAYIEKSAAAAEVSQIEILTSSSTDPPCAHWQGGRRQQLCLLIKQGCSFLFTPPSWTTAGTLLALADRAQQQHEVGR